MIVEIGLSLVLIVSLVIIFCLLAIICDEYLVPAVEILIREFKVPEEVAGVTLLALGSSTPGYSMIFAPVLIHDAVFEK